MLGRLLCRLGIHDNMMSGFNWDSYLTKVQSTWGFCLRCNKSWQLDNE